MQIFAPYIRRPREAEEVEEALGKVELPPWVVHREYELGEDHDGAPAVWVSLFVDETTAPWNQLGRFLIRTSQRFLDALLAAGNGRWPYVRVRTAVEHKTV